MSKEKILKIAVEEFAKHGYEGVSMNNLAKKLELNKATIYYHFEDKKSLYNEVLKSILTDSQEELHAIAYANEPATKRLKNYIKFLTCKIASDTKIISIMYREMANFGINIDKNILEYINKDIEAFNNIIQDLHVKKSYSHIDIQSFKFMIVSTIMSYLAIQNSNHELKYLNSFDTTDKLSEYLSNYISNLLIDSISKGEKNA